jgi:putative ABC transport system permease protein
MRIARLGRIMRIGARSLLLHKLRTLLSVLGIIFGVGAVVSMLSIGEGAKQEALDQIRQLGAQNVIVRRVELTTEQEREARKQLSLGLTLEDAGHLERAIPFARDVVPVRIVNAPLVGVSQVGPSRLAPELVATRPAYLVAKGIAIKTGRFLTDLDMAEARSICVLGYDAAAALGAGGVVGASVRFENTLFRVVGVLEKTEWIKGRTAALSARNTNRDIFIPIGADRTVVATPGGYTPIDEIVLHCNTSEDVEAAGHLTDSILAQRHRGVVDYEVIVPQELIRQAQASQRIWNIVLGCIAGISLLVGGIGIMNIMLATVSERTREIGIRRAVGASRAHIVFQFLVEAVLLTFAGGVLGLGLGLVGAHLITLYAGWETIVTVWSVGLSLGTSVLVGTFFGLYPAWKAAHLDPIEALRYE